MTQEEILLAAIVRTPSDNLAWLALADWLEEDGQAARAELLRLSRHLPTLPRDYSQRPSLEARVIELLGAGVKPAGPEWTNSVGMRFRLIPPGRFWMGAPDDEEGGDEDERPMHAVAITRPYWLGVTPVTQRQWHAVRGYHQSYYRKGGDGAERVGRRRTADYPAEAINSLDINGFFDALVKRPGEEGRVYRLPTEAEWEYACRGGGVSTTQFHFGDRLTKKLAHYAASGLEHPCPVGKYPPNVFGLHDLHGNVWEWCSDWLGVYPAEARTDPTGPESGTYRMHRGGSWSDDEEFCRSAFRGNGDPLGRSGNVGIRVVLEWKE